MEKVLNSAFVTSIFTPQSTAQISSVSRQHQTFLAMAPRKANKRNASAVPIDENLAAANPRHKAARKARSSDAPTAAQGMANHTFIVYLAEDLFI